MNYLNKNLFNLRLIDFKSRNFKIMIEVVKSKISKNNIIEKGIFIAIEFLYSIIRILFMDLKYLIW